MQNLSESLPIRSARGRVAILGQRQRFAAGLDRLLGLARELERELVAASEALERRKDGLRHFASIFREVAHAREGGWGTDIPRFHRRENVSRADEQFAERIADASAPFWRHVREALRAQRHAQPPRPRL